MFKKNSWLILASLSAMACQPAERLEVSQRVEYLVKDTALFDYFWLDYDGVAVYASPEEKRLEKYECKLFFHEFADFQTLLKEMPTENLLRIYQQKGNSPFAKEALEVLQSPAVDLVESDVQNVIAGKRIVIDPVFVEGILRMISSQGDTILLEEPTLTGAVAKILEAKLKKRHASVMLTRIHHPSLAQKVVEVLSDLTEQETLARQINAFRPDATLSIKLQVSTENSQKPFKPKSDNYCLAFIPGAFMKKDLTGLRDRLEFMRLLTGPHYEQSVQLSMSLIRTFGTSLNIQPVAAASAKAFEKYTLNVSSGVYARNLAITRLVRGPVCYTIPLCLDNAEECVLWSKKEVKIGNIIASKRAEEVADAYIEALESFFGQNGTESKLSGDDLIETEVQ